MTPNELDAVRSIVKRSKTRTLGDDERAVLSAAVALLGDCLGLLNSVTQAAQAIEVRHAHSPLREGR